MQLAVGTNLDLDEMIASLNAKALELEEQVTALAAATLEVFIAFDAHETEVRQGLRAEGRLAEESIEQLIEALAQACGFNEAIDRVGKLGEQLEDAAQGPRTGLAAP